MKQLNAQTFNRKYRELILHGDFFEEPDYYIRERPRYLHTLQLILANIGDDLDLSKLHVLEIGGGQISLLMHGLFGSTAAVADVNDKYSDWLLKNGCEFRICDLLHDNLIDEERFGLVIMCEVIEHFPVPPMQILGKIKKWMKPGGVLFLTTPNLHRLRNVIRLLFGLRVFDNFFIPDPGQSIGHPIEYSADHLAWQIEQAGFANPQVLYRQLSLTGATTAVRLARYALSPLLIRKKFRDSLVATAHIRRDT
jgi:2-polyprenyl-3-methyl-5-hydroxy-6-metoxy-1,4-benzoquinol methylase